MMITRFSFVRWGLGVLVVAMAATAQASPRVLVNPSEADLLQELLGDGEGEVTSKGLSFRRTAPPNPQTNLCAGSDGGQGQGGAANKTLVVVPYNEGAVNANLAIQFETGTDRLGANDQAVLNRLASVMQKAELRTVRFAVAGHTDKVGSDAVNLPLSCARALSVRKYLISRGVAADRLTAYGFGSAQPLNPDRRDAPENRRVEIRRGDQ